MPLGGVCIGCPPDGIGCPPDGIGWFAVKVVSEAILRTGVEDPERIAAFLGDPRTAFDGHKGRPLRFRASDHRLEQPLYRADGSGEAEAADAPPESTPCASSPAGS